MQVPLEISFHNTEPSENLERKVRERVDKLHRFNDRIVSCHVAIEVPNRTRSPKVPYRVRVDVRVPDKELVVSKDPGPDGEHFDPYLMVRDAFDAMERRLEEHSREKRGEVKTSAAPLQGRILRRFADHGFIAVTDGSEVFFHRNSVVGTPFESLDPGETVELVLMHGESPVGPQATTVKKIRPMAYNPDPPA